MLENLCILRFGVDARGKTFIIAVLTQNNLEVIIWRDQEKNSMMSR